MPASTQQCFYLNTTQNNFTGDGTTDIFPFDSEEFSPAPTWYSAFSGGRVTISETGVYVVSASIFGSGSSGVDLTQLGIYRNGSNVSGTHVDGIYFVAAGSGKDHGVAAVVPITSAGQIIDVRVRWAGTKPASRIKRQINASLRQYVVPAALTTFSSIIVLPRSFAPWKSVS